MKNLAVLAFQKIAYGIGFYVRARVEISTIFGFYTPNASSLLPVSDQNIGPYTKGYRAGVNRLRRHIVTT